MTLEAILAAAVGLAIGVLVALFIDSQTLGRRIQKANADKQNAQKGLQKFQIQHRAVAQALQQSKMDLQTAIDERTQLEETIARQLQEIEAGREQLQITINTNDALKENVEEARLQMEEIDALRLLTEEKLKTAESENGRLVGDLQLLEAEVALLEEKLEKLAAAVEQVAELEQNVTALNAQIADLEAEKDAALAQLNQAELACAEKSAEISTLQKQLQEAEAVRQELSATQEELETADTHLKKLQDTMDDVQTKLSYSGKHQLQLIRGIGPTYARRLNEFGIQTFADLAECNEQQIAKIIKKKEWQAINIQEWLDEAKALAASLNEDN